MDEIEPLRIINSSPKAGDDPRLVDKSGTRQETDDTLIGSSGGFADQYANFHFFQFFGVPASEWSNDTINDKVTYIRKRLINKMNTKDSVDLMRELRHMDANIGSQPMGVSRLDHLYQYCKLSQQVDDLEEEREWYINRNKERPL